MADAKAKGKKAEAQVEEAVEDDFAALLQKEFKPKSDRAKEDVQNAVQTLAEQVLEGEVLIGDDVVGTISAIIAEIDLKLTEQVNAIMHNEDFRKLEGAWRGLHHLVNNSETDEMLKIRVMNISKKELGKTLKKYKGTAWDQSPLFKKIYEEEYGQLGGEPHEMIASGSGLDGPEPQAPGLTAGRGWGVPDALREGLDCPLHRFDVVAVWFAKWR